MSSTKTSSLLSPSLDFLLIGGLSIVGALMVFVWTGKITADLIDYQSAYYLSFVANFPHLIVTYFILYGDFRRQLMKDLKLFSAGVLIPAALIAFFAACLYLEKMEVLGLSVNLMFFLLGWHYVWQTFGAIVVANSRRQISYAKAERQALQINLIALWFWYWISINRIPQYRPFEGILFRSFQLGEFWMPLASAGVVVTLAWLAFVSFQRYRREGNVAAPLAWVSFIASYVWFLPQFFFPGYLFMFPLFHSLQYLLFVMAYRKNKATALAEQAPSQQRRKTFLLHFPVYMLAAVLVGGLAMRWLPNTLDSTGWLNPEKYGQTPFLFMFTIFINLHHYFIDSVVWRSRHPEMQSFLFRP